MYDPMDIMEERSRNPSGRVAIPCRTRVACPIAYLKASVEPDAKI